MWLALGTQTRRLRDGEIVVGGGADADWRITMADLMPRHFTIVVHGLNASLRLSSKDNIVVVNGRQLGAAPHLLNDGDVIQAGAGRFVFSDEEPKVQPLGEAAPDQAYLVDESAGVAHELRSRSTTIGRDRSNAIVIRDPGASRFHAEIRREAGGFALHSMGSSGTMYNGRRLDAPVLLEDGDRLEIAYAPLRFARTVPEGVQVAPVHDPRNDATRRNPTLATGKISPVPPEKPLIRRTWAAAFLVVAILAALFAAFR